MDGYRDECDSNGSLYGPDVLICHVASIKSKVTYNFTSEV